jgi:hypothetical protein
MSHPCHSATQYRGSNAQIKEWKCNFIIKSDWEWEFKSLPKTLPQGIHVALTAVAAVLIGKNLELISLYLSVFSAGHAVGNGKIIPFQLLVRSCRMDFYEIRYQIIQLAEVLLGSDFGLKSDVKNVNIYGSVSNKSCRKKN